MLPWIEIPASAQAEPWELTEVCSRGVMRVALWALGLGVLLLRAKAAPTGKGFLPPSMEASGGSAPQRPRPWGVRVPSCDQLSTFFWYCLYFQNCILAQVHIKPRTELKYSSSSFPLLLCFNFKYNIEGKESLFLFKMVNWTNFRLGLS